MTRREMTAAALATWHEREAFAREVDLRCAESDRPCVAGISGTAEPGTNPWATRY